MSLFNYIFMTPLDELCCDHRQHFDFFQDVNRIHDEKYHPCPSIICVVIDNILAFFPTQTWSCWLYLKFLAILEIVPCVFLVIFNPIVT